MSNRSYSPIERVEADIHSVQRAASLLMHLGDHVDRMLADAAALSVLGEPGHPDADLLIVANQAYPEHVRLDAAKRLAAGVYRRPIARKKRDAHDEAIEEAIRAEQASHEQSAGVVWIETTARAVLVAISEAQRPRPTVRMTINGRLKTVGHRDGRGLVVWDDLPWLYFKKWMRNRVSDETLGMLVPDWRDRERRYRNQLRDDARLWLESQPEEPLEPSDDDPVDYYEPVELVEAARRETLTIKPTSTVADRVEALLGALTPREREVALGMSKGWNSTDVASELGIKPATVRVLWSRVCTKAQEQLGS